MSRSLSSCRLTTTGARVCMIGRSGQTPANSQAPRPCSRVVPLFLADLLPSPHVPPPTFPARSPPPPRRIQALGSHSPPTPSPPPRVSEAASCTQDTAGCFFSAIHPHPARRPGHPPPSPAPADPTGDFVISRPQTQLGILVCHSRGRNRCSVLVLPARPPSPGPLPSSLRLAARA